jgi:peptidyl-prolyl cis-trans isomerase D
MLETMRQSTKSLLIWVLFAIIIAVFIISFGPQSGQSSGCGSASQHAMTVGGRDVSLHSWRFAVNGLGIGSGGSGAQAAQRRTQALDFLLERELLAQAAEARGMRVSEDVVAKALAAGELYVMGFRLDGTKAYYRDGAFDDKMLERFAMTMGLPNVGALVKEQTREHLAELTRGTLLDAARVSDEEARATFIRENTKVTADAVVFDVARYRAALALDDAALTAFAAGHAAELDAAWKTQQAEWSTDKPRVQIRHLSLHRGAPAAEGSPAVDPARAKIDEARARIAKGADFGAVARELSEDDETKALGGRVGWRPAESLGYGKEVVDATKPLAVGALSEVIEAPDGYHLVQVVARSDKALTLEDKRLDLAAELAPAAFARALAERDANAALAKAATTPLEELFEREPKAHPTIRGEGLPPGITPESLGLPPGTELDVAPSPPPAPAPAPAPSSKPVDAPAAPEEGPQGWVLREGPLRFAQAGDAAPAPPAAPIAVDGPLPAVKVAPPYLETVGPIARSGDFLAGVGKSKELMGDLFDVLEVGQVATKLYPVETPDGFAIVRLTARTDADLAAFDAERAKLVASMAQQKSVVLLLAWIDQRCKAAIQAGSIAVQPEVLQIDDGKMAPYAPCKNLNFMSVVQQLETRR